jgi:micrococcal nuclease
MVAPMLLLAAALTICAPGPRDNCVVDGDTFWLAGEKIRLADIDTPETAQAKCTAERQLGERAKLRLQALLNACTLRVTRRGQDRYGRTLARVTVNGHDVGAVLIGEGLARAYDGRRRHWC